jgi:L-threonylcarbamoyladenylate synthase
VASAKAIAVRASEATAKCQAALAAAKLVDVDDNYDGTYDVIIRPRREGLYQLHVLLNGELVLGSPQRLRVIAAKPAAEHCILVPVLFEAVVGAQVTFSLQLRDEFGNELSSPPGTLALDFIPSRAGGTVDTLSSSVSSIERSMDLLEAPEVVREASSRQQARPSSALVWRPMPLDAARAAHQLFAVLRELDAMGVARIWVERPPAGTAWDGVRDRLERAAA